MISIWLAGALTGGLIPSPKMANGHEVRLFVSASGLDFLERQIPSFAPSEVAVSEVTVELAKCTDTTAITWTQRNTDLQLQVQSLDLSIPATDTLRIDMTLDASLDGEAFVENPFVCLGSITCGDHVRVVGVRSVVEATVTNDAEGLPVVNIISTDVALDDYNVSFWLTDCLIDDLANWIVGMGKDMILGEIEKRVESTVAELGPLIQQQLQKVARGSATIDYAFLSWTSSRITLNKSGLDVVAKADVWSPYPPAECLGEDPGEPLPIPGVMPQFVGDTQNHLAAAVSLSLVEDALYHFWRRGLTCVTDEHLAELGIQLDLPKLLGLLPGFPPGSTFSVDLKILKPAKITGIESQSASISMAFDAIRAAVVGVLPNGQTRSLVIDVGANGSGDIRLDAPTNSLVLRVKEVHIAKLAVEDSGLGLDPTRLTWLLETKLIPTLLAQLPPVPLFGPAVGANDVYLIPRQLASTSSHTALTADLFRAPANDVTPPTTAVLEWPDQVVAPANAKVRLLGADDLTPVELVRFRIATNDGPPELTFANEWNVGKPGVSANYQLVISAVDLADNADPSPLTLQIAVDGVAPNIWITSPTAATAAPGRIQVTWSAHDDVTSTHVIKPSIEVLRFSDLADMSTVVSVKQAELPAGATAFDTTIDDVGVYQVVVTVADTAGNSAFATANYTIQSPSGCRQTEGAWPVAGLGLLVALRMGRRRAGASAP